MKLMKGLRRHLQPRIVLGGLVAFVAGELIVFAIHGSLFAIQVITWPYQFQILVDVVFENLPHMPAIEAEGKS